MTDTDPAAKGVPDDEQQRIDYYVGQAKAATTPEDLAKVLIQAGWGTTPGDPPIERWPAFRVIVPLLRAVLDRG